MPCGGLPRSSDTPIRVSGSSEIREHLWRCSRASAALEHLEGEYRDRADEGPSNLPQAAKPSVFHLDGKRLFVIDGEPRVADEDLAKDIELARARNIRTSLIDPNRDKLLLLGSIVQVDPKECALIRHDSDPLVQPLFEKAVAEAMLQLLKAEGLIDPSKRGEKPKINFLNAEQAKFLIVSSATPKGRDLLVGLIKLEKAWRDGTLEPARPAVEPPKAPAAPQPARIALAPRMEFGHRDGVVFATGDDRPHVLGDSVAEALGLTVGELSAELAKWSQLASLGEMPVYEGHHGIYLNKAHVTFLMSRSGAFLAACRTIAAVMEALDERKAYLHDGEVHFRDRDFYISCEREARKLAEAVERGRWLPAPSAFLRCRHGFLRMRHDRVAHFFHRTAEGVAADVRRLREAIEDDRARVLERFEVEDGVLVIGLYLTMPQVARLGEFTGDCAEGILETFDAWRDVDARLMEAMESDQLAFAKRAVSLRVDPGEFAAAAASAGALEAVAGLRADFVAAGLLPDPGRAGDFSLVDGTPGEDLRSFSLRGLLARLRRGH